ncbi:MAG: ABC transporter permease [Thermoanaerobacter sp.]|nr:ABC transporter permease [Thermoanaerobacter sp.]
MYDQIREIYTYREMLRNLVAKELRARYKGSVLGFLWTFFNPLLMLVVYSVVFSFVMRSQIENYSMFLFVALLPWNYLSVSVLQGAASLVQNGALIKKIYFPREILPLSVVLANLVNYLLSLLILVPALLVFNIKLTTAILAFPVVLMVETMLVTSLALCVSVANVYFRDLEHIVGILMTVWFFLTPVLYPVDIIPAKVKPFFNLNPATPLMEAYRAIFFYGRWPDWVSLGYLAAGLAVLLMLSLVFFNRLQRNIAEEI